VEQQRLLYGNWKIRPAAGLKFPRNKWRVIDAVPDGVERWIRFWDKAATEGGLGARTAGVLMGRLRESLAQQLGFRYVIANTVADRWGDAERESRIRATAELDRASHGNVTIGMEQEPGSGGKHSTYVTITGLAGFDVYREPSTTNKAARWSPMAAQQQVGNIAIAKGAPGQEWDWADFVRELDALSGDEALDKGKLKDLADAASGAFKGLTNRGHVITGDILASGDRNEDDRTKLTNEELEDPDTPDFIKDLLVAYREDGDRGYGDDAGFGRGR
jgi:phage terminase large subunit-like protein